MSDLIDRQAAIERYGDWYVEEGTEEGFISDMEHFLKMLPSAEPERTKGKWMGTVCSVCGESIANYFDCDYCPKCGARMDEK